MLTEPRAVGGWLEFQCMEAHGVLDVIYMRILRLSSSSFHAMLEQDTPKGIRISRLPEHIGADLSASQSPSLGWPSSQLSLRLGRWRPQGHW